MEIFIIVIVITIGIIIVINTKKTDNNQRSIEMDVPNPSKATSERVLKFIQNQPADVIKQVHVKFTNMNVDFNGLEKYYLQRINGNFNFKKALSETKPKKLKISEDVNFDHFQTKKVPSKTYQTESKIPRKLLYPKKDLEDNSHYFFGKKVVISGTFENFPYRAEIAKMLWEVGADVDTSVTKNTNILISGAGVGWRKLEKAEENKIIIIDETKFLSYFPDYETTYS